MRLRNLLVFLLWVACGAFADVPSWRSIQDDAFGLVASGPDARYRIQLRERDRPLRSADAGASWQAFDVGGERPVYVIGSPSRPGLFFAATGFSAPGCCIELALYRTLDGGATWTRAGTTSSEGATISRIVVAGGGSESRLYGGRSSCASCVLVSDDAGSNWRAINRGLAWSAPFPGMPAQTILAASQSDADVVYALTSAGIFRSADGGESWEKRRSSARTW